MKNKFLNSMGLVILLNLACIIPSMAQANEPAGKNDQQDKLEQRSENQGKWSQGQYRGNMNRMRGDSSKPHFGGKQNFQGRSPRGDSFRGQFRGPQNFRDSYMYREGFKAGRYSQGFQERSLRNNQFGGQRFGRNKPGGAPRQNQGSMDRGWKGNNAEIKALKEQIWKDGVMDLKERDQLQTKMRSLHSQKPGVPMQDKKEKLQKSPDKNK